jgi:hypothetical protein
MAMRGCEREGKRERESDTQRYREGAGGKQVGRKRERTFLMGRAAMAMLRAFSSSIIAFVTGTCAQRV